MKQFPTILNVNNKDKFSDTYYNRILCYLRKEIFEHILINTENEFFDLERFKKIKKLNELQYLTISKQIISELENIGWKCKLSYGNTALFIYSTDLPPPSCWD